MPRHHGGVDSNKPPLHDLLARTRGARRDPELAQLIAARHTAESAIGLAMATSGLPGVEVHYIAPLLVELPPGKVSPNE